MSDNDTQLLANCWTHSGDVDPSPGAHGHRSWSAWSIERRAENLSNAGFDAIGLHHEDLVHVLEVEFADESDREAGLEPVSYTHFRVHETGRNIECGLLL